MRCNWKRVPEYVSKNKGLPMWMCARSGCRRYGFARSDKAFGNVPCLHPHVGLGDAVSKAIKTTTLGLVRECQKCSYRRKVLNRWLLVLPSFLARFFGREIPLPWRGRFSAMFAASVRPAASVSANADHKSSSID